MKLHEILKLVKYQSEIGTCIVELYVDNRHMEATVTKKKGPKALMVRFGEELRSRIAEMAHKEDRPMNYIVLKIVEAHFQKEQKQ